ncbi:kelch-like protein 26 [Saccostrea echinata]|uniref:kelch-like protein 26 n=1 Tax=Saccostrea echinata TaxID=191078 RepID=UPI002A80188A|nr:kelch-like protein 26 [Saccostrea echinata]
MHDNASTSLCYKPDNKSSMDAKGPAAMTAVCVYQSISPQCRKAMNEYLRTGNINENFISYDHIREYLTICSSIHGLHQLRNLCMKKLLHNLNKNTMFDIFNLADEFDISDVLSKCADEIMDSINHVILFPEFMSLTSTQMEALVKSPQCKNKLCVRDALYQWWQYDTDKRTGVYETLRHKVDSNLFPIPQRHCDSRSYLVTFSLNQKGNNKNQLYPEANVLDLQTEKEYSASIKKNLEMDKGFAVCCMQPAVSEPPYIFLSGGNRRSSKKMLECDVIMNKWKVCSNMKNSRSFHAMEAVRDKLYVFGGRHEGKNVSQIEEFDRKKNSWTVVGNLKWNVHSTASAVCGDFVYLFGGKRESGDNVSVIQVFDCKTKSVDIVGYLPVECSGGRCMVIGHSIYIFNEQGHCIKYCAEDNTSLMLTSQPACRHRFSLYLRGSHFSINGGLDSQQNSPEYNLKYSIHDESWKQMSYRGRKFRNPEIFGQCFVKIPNDLQYIPFS